MATKQIAEGSIVTYRDRQHRVVLVDGGWLCVFPSSPSENDRKRGPFRVSRKQVELVADYFHTTTAPDCGQGCASLDQHNERAQQMEKKAEMTWRTEFGEAYAVPEVIGNDPELLDVSYRNDVCPSFVVKGNTAEILRLWVEHPDRAQREWPEEHRYAITVTREDGPEPAPFMTNDPAAAVAELKRLSALPEYF